MTPPFRLLHAALLLSACGAGAGGTAASSNAAEAVTTSASAEAPTPPAATPPGEPTSSVEAPQAAATDADAAKTASHATMVAEMRRMLVGKATLDGDAVTDVKQVDACHTNFTTTKGAAVIDWTKGGNIAPRQQGGRELNDLPGSDGTHPLSMPTGSDADGVSGAVGLLVAECTQ